MVRRLGVVSAVALSVVLASGAPAAAESIHDKVARQQAETRAKIACAHAEARGQSCAPKPVAKSASSGRSSSKASPSSGGGSGKRIEISIGEQVLRAYEGNRVVISTPVSTGARGTETPTGRFKVQSKERNHWSTQFGVWMPYAMRVVRGIFIHELPLTEDGRRIGTSSLGHAVSHGCIRVGVGTAERLYNWTPVGTPVLIN